MRFFYFSDIIYGTKYEPSGAFILAMLECYWKGKNIFLRRFGIGSHFSFLVKIKSHEKRIKWIEFIIKIYIFLIFYYNQISPLIYIYSQNTQFPLRKRQ